jgi:hypothetical protein
LVHDTLLSRGALWTPFLVYGQPCRTEILVFLGVFTVCMEILVLQKMSLGYCLSQCAVVHQYGIIEIFLNPISGNPCSAEERVDGFTKLSRCAFTGLGMSRNLVVLVTDDATFIGDAKVASFFCLRFFNFSPFSFVPCATRLIFLMMTSDTICSYQRRCVNMVPEVWCKPMWVKTCNKKHITSFFG